MKPILLCLSLLIVAFANAQDINKIINAKEVGRIEKVLSSDSLQGRKVFTPGIDMAADFISREFKKAGLKTLKGLQGYKQSFAMLKPQVLSLQATVDGQAVPDDNVLVVSTKEDVSVTEKSGFDTLSIGAKDNFLKLAMKAIQSTKNTVVFLDSSLKSGFKRLAYFTK